MNDDMKFPEQSCETDLTGLEVAVIGLSGRFPGAGDVDGLWSSILRKQETISVFTKQELRAEGIPEELLSHPDYVRAAGIIEQKEYFDPFFFGFSPNEACLMDPQLRIFLECSWQALEQAGCDPLSFPGKIGLYAGSSPNLGWELLVRESGLRDVVGNYSASLVTDKDLLTQHVSYRLNLRGPSVNLQTACSTSLVAVHLAIQGLLGGDCQIALAGGVSASSLRKSGYLYQEGMIMSPDGHCRSFDEKAAGTVFGEGAGVVVLRLLADAKAAGDHILAVIRSSAVNNDGKEKAGFTATSVTAQVDLLETAHRAAGIGPEAISFVEAHGAGTRLGDPIEVEALGRVFGGLGERACAIGSVKTNVGHLNRAAGITGFIKAVMALNDRVIPPQMNFNRVNPEIEITRTPFYVCTETEEVPTGNGPIFAGVSSFGIGGTNAHVVLEGPPSPPSQEPDRDSPQIVVLSAKSAVALDEMTSRLADFLARGTHPPSLADVAFTLQQGRAAFDFRRMFVASSTAELVEKVRTGKYLGRSDLAGTSQVVFMFPGQGAQYRNMGRPLYDRFPRFRNIIEKCFRIFRDRLSWDLKPHLYPEHDRAPSREGLTEMRILQPALFVFQYSLAQFLMEVGIRPAAMIGYSFGEYVAGCIAGVFTLEDAIELAAFRGELMEHLPPGKMLSVPLPEDSVRPMLGQELSLAAVNGPSCIVAGASAAIEEFDLSMKERGLLCMPVKTRYAGHVKMPLALKTSLREKIHSLRPAPVAIPYLSSLSGDWIEVGRVLGADYWGEHMVNPIRFYQGMELLSQNPQNIFLEVGAGRDLTLLGSRLIQDGAREKCLYLVPPDNSADEGETLAMRQIGRLWLDGRNLRWDRAFGQENRRKIPLPTYPFQRQAYWPATGVFSSLRWLQGKEAAGSRLNPDDWGHVATWKRVGRIQAPLNEPSTPSLTVVFLDHGTFGTRIAQDLEQQGRRVVRVRQGSAFSVTAPHELVVVPDCEEDYFKAFDTILTGDEEALTILHCWGFKQAVRENQNWETFVSAQFDGYFSLQFIARALGRRDWKSPTELLVITNELQDVLGGETTCPKNIPLLAAVKVIPREYSNIHCRSVDLAGNAPSWNEALGARCVIAELSTPNSAREVAYRGAWRWVRSYARAPLPSVDGVMDLLKPDAGYLITGGLGGMGLVLAKSLAERRPVRLILTGRSRLPPRDEWSDWLRKNGVDNQVSQKIFRIQEIERLGSRVCVVQADCSDFDAMKSALDRHAGEVGEIRGVIHAAGVTDGAIIQRRKVLTCLEIMKPKIQGTYVLESLFPPASLDFFVACSSISSVAPSVGQIAYCASNLFLDCWATEQVVFHHARCWSIGWDIWKESGMGRLSYQEMQATGAHPALLRAKEEALRRGIRDGEGVETFWRVLAQAEPHIIVSTQDLDQLLSCQAQFLPSPGLLESGSLPLATRAMARPRPDTPVRALQTATQIALGNIWKTFFGIDEISADDDFFELGGDSLKATVVVRRIHEDMDVAISLVNFFENSRLEKLATLIEQTRKTLHPAIPRVAPAERYEVSHAQLRLWLLQQFGATGHAYNRSSILRLRGAFDLARFRDSFMALIERHEPLRTAFVIKDGRPFQVIHSPSDFSLWEEDLRSAAEPEAEVRVRVREEMTWKFDLSVPPLFRVRLLTLSQDELIAIFTIHHIVCDQLSVNILHRELAVLYNSVLRDGRDLPALPVQYKDYVDWSRRLTDPASVEAKTHKEFWERYLAGDLPQTSVPPDKQRPSEKTYRGSSISGALSGEISVRLLNLAQEGKLSLFMALVSLVEVLLHRYTGDEDLLLGTAVSGRDHVQLEHPVGFFVNTLPLRYQIGGHLTFRELLARTKKSTLEALEYQNYPFDKIVEDRNLARDPARNPLFEIMILFHPDEEATNGFLGVHAESLQFPSDTSLFDLTLNFRQAHGKIRFEIEYNTDLYLDEKMESVRHHLEIAADWLSSHPDAPIETLPLTTSGDEKCLILSREGVEQTFPPECTIVQLLEARVEQQPDQMALVSRSGALTYRELNERANRLAHYLAARFPLRPDCRIGICLERSEDLVVAILAVLKAGAAFVPIDPDYPPDRVEFILRDSGALAVLIGEGENRFLDFEPVLPAVSIRDAFSSLGTNPPGPATSHNLAYVAYTSGSSGRPKGVMIEHRNVVNYLENCAGVFGILPQDTVYGLTAITFDISVMEIVGSLVMGARLFLEHDVFDMGAISARIRQERVSVLQLTPTRLRTYLEQNSITSLSGIRLILVGGEVLPPSLHAELRRLDQTRVFHVYGPTETTIWSAADLIDGDALSLGIPLAGEEICIVGIHSTLMPRGFPGEICIAGEGVGRGYLNQPELSRKNFVSFPFLSGKRSYRTGDVGKITLDGKLQFLGRNDSQVKIQGVRVETAEIENQLLRHEAVKGAVVLARDKEGGGKTLWAYVISEAAEKELRGLLAKHLPYYLIPEVFVYLTSFPKTANGKTDRQGLLHEARQDREDVPDADVPSPVERELIGIWEEILKPRKRLDTRDNFFALGGNSLKAAQVITQIQEELRVRLTLRDVFAGPTIGELARLVEATEWANAKEKRPIANQTEEFIV